MTQEDKELLKDICARMPYGVKFKCCNGFLDDHYTLISINEQYIIGESTDEYEPLFFIGEDDIKPYLRSMTSMTEEEKKEYLSLCQTHIEHDADDNVNCYYFDTFESFDWLNKNMFDYRGLIPKGCAIEVTEDNNPYKN